MSGLRFFDELGVELERAARRTLPVRGVGERSGWWARVRQRVRAGLRAAPVLLGVAVTFAIVVGTLLAVHHHQHGPSALPTGPAPAVPATGLFAPLSEVQTRGQRLIEAAWLRTEHEDPGCVPGLSGLTFSNGTPSATLLSSLSVLRRPGAGVSLERDSALSSAGLGQNVYGRYARLARAERLGAGSTTMWAYFYIAPAGNVLGPLPPAARCYAEQAVALAGELAQVPASVRTLTLALATRERNAQQHPEGVSVEVVLMSIAGEAPADVYSATTSGLAQRGAIGHGFSADYGTILSGVTPDGVASVTLDYPAATQAGETAAAFTVTARPVNNVFVVRVPRAFGVSTPRRVVWRGADGTIVKTILSTH